MQERPEPAEPQREEPVMDLGDPMILLQEGLLRRQRRWQNALGAVALLAAAEVGLVLFSFAGPVRADFFSYAGRTPDAETRVKEIKLLLTKTVFAHWSYLRRMKVSACRESCATMPKGLIPCAWHKVCSTLFILM